MTMRVLALALALLCLAGVARAAELQPITTNDMTTTGDPMLEALYAPQANPALADKLRLYGRFVGSWDLDVDYYPAQGAAQHAPAEWHFATVLDGRAIQDVWIFPSRQARAGHAPVPWWFYGSTFRWYDPAIDGWHITYYEPTRPFALQQIGRAAGSDIVQMTGEDPTGLIRRWRFVEITDTSFRWIGDASRDKGVTWTLELEMRARRVK